jgi:hypothetical protein
MAAPCDCLCRYPMKQLPKGQGRALDAIVTDCGKAGMSQAR